MSFKRLFLATLLITFFKFTLTGCNNNSNNNINSITLGIWQGNAVETTVLEELINKFTEETGINVNVRIYHDYQTQLQTELIGGTAPDVFYMEAFLFPSLYQTGVLYPLDNFINHTSEFNSYDFFAPAYNSFTGSNGYQYGVPKDLSTLALYYNVELLENAGFTPDDIPNAIEDFPQFLLNLHNNLPEGSHAFLSTPELTRHMFLLEANGIQITDDNGFAILSKPDQLVSLQLLMDGFKEGIVVRAIDLGNDWAGDSFGSGNVALMVEGNWALSHLDTNFSDIEYGVMELPTVNGMPGTMMFSVSYSINSSSNNKDMAWEFIEFITSRTGMRHWTEGAGLLPARQSVSNDLNLYENPILSPFVLAGEYATPWQKGDTLPIIMREYDNHITSVISGNSTLKDAMEVAETTANLDIETQLR